MKSISVEAYLRTAYHPDRDYVGGRILHRNWSDRRHSETQRELILFFGTRGKEWNVSVFPGQQVQINASRVRVPDICVYVGAEPADQIFRTPPFICIEVLSPEDRWERTQQKLDDYLNFGVLYVWVLNPRERRAWSYTKNGSVEVKDGVLRTDSPSLVVPLAEIFGD